MAVIVAVTILRCLSLPANSGFPPDNRASALNDTT
jgi:hypothetical protein